MKRDVEYARGVAKLSTVFWSAALVFAAGASAGPAPPKARPSGVSQQEILQQLATTQRMLAEEQFLAGQRDLAKSKYDDASQTVARLTTEDGFNTEAGIQLQKDEIAYRKLLLEREASFWGFQFAARPINPISAVYNFHQSFMRFKGIVKEVADLAAQIDANNANAFAVGDQLMQTEVDQRVSELRTDEADVRLRDAASRRQMYQDRKRAIQDRQTEIAAEIRALEQQIASRSASMNTMLVSALSDQLGLPPQTSSLLTGAAKGNFNSVVQAAVQQYAQSAALPTSLSGELKEVATTARQAAEEYQQIRKTVQDVTAKAQQGAAILKAIQSHDRDKLIAVGLDALGKLSPEAKSQLLSGVSQARQFADAVALAGSGTQVREAIARYLASSQDLSHQMETAFNKYLDSEADDFSARYRQTLATAISLATTAEQQTTTLAKLSHAWPQSLVKDVLRPAGAVKPVAVALGSACTGDVECGEWLTTWLRANTLGGPYLDVSVSGEATITVNGQVKARFNVSEFAKTLSGRFIETGANDLKKDVTALIARIQSSGEASVREVVKRLPDVDFDRYIDPVLKALPANHTTALGSLLNASPGGGAPSPVTQDLASLSLGKEIAKQTIFATPAATPGAAPANPAPAAADPQASSDPTGAALTSALRLAGPYGALAATAIQLFTGIAQNGVAIDQINAKAREDENLTAEMLHITVFEADLNRDEAIAGLEQRIANTQYDGAKDRSQRFGQRLIVEGANNRAIEAAIRARLPLAYLLSEQLRERFDMADHALAFWRNDLGQGQFIERSVRSDPQLRRLGLDPDISLYEWFSRDAEGQRKDLDALVSHWDQIDVALQNLCTRIHCTEQDVEMGDVSMTSTISMRTFMGPEAWAEGSRTHVILFTLLPQNVPGLPQSVPGVAVTDGLRLVDVRGGVDDGAHNYRVDPRVQLRHSGLGYIASRGHVVRETLEASSSRSPILPIDDASSSQLQTRLQSRWSQQHWSVPYVDGYPLFGLYSLQFPNDFDFVHDDVVLRFFYQRPATLTNATGELATIQFECVVDGRQVRIDSSAVSLLLQTDDNGRPTILGANNCHALETTP